MKRVLLWATSAMTALFLIGALTAPQAEARIPVSLVSPVPQEAQLRVTIQNRGTVVIKLHTAEAPRTTAHIMKLAESNFYDGQKFFRVLKEPKPFLVLFGDPQSRTKSLDDPSMGTQGSGTRIPFEETGKRNVAGAVGLSTLPRDRDSGDSQFYILLEDKPFLDGSYTVFGQVVQGMDIVRQITVGDQVTSVTVTRG